jgi:hypothetical protein
MGPAFRHPSFSQANKNKTSPASAGFLISGFKLRHYQDSAEVSAGVQKEISARNQKETNYSE